MLSRNKQYLQMRAAVEARVRLSGDTIDLPDGWTLIRQPSKPEAFRIRCNGLPPLRTEWASFCLRHFGENWRDVLDLGDIENWVLGSQRELHVVSFLVAFELYK